MALTREYPHLPFTQNWHLDDGTNFALGQCDGLIRAIKKSPIQPQYYTKLMGVSLIKGAQATTAIEGNTLTFEEILKIEKGERLPESKEYQEKEVSNILDAFGVLLSETVFKHQSNIICPELLLRFHKMVGKDLDGYFEATPGRFRENEVIVGRYRCPDHLDVVPLIDSYCEFLKKQFKYETGQNFKDVVVEAIVAHVYLELIHPFGDGNGRTGRLLEFYILLRGGLPNIVLQILSNHYNHTRTEYYKQIERVSETRDVSAFITYAVRGFRDGLKETLETILESQTEQTWKNYIHDKFSHISGQKEVIKRRRKLALNFPLVGEFAIDEIPKLNMETAFTYSGISEKTLVRDVEELVGLEILKRNEGKFSSNKSILNGNLPVYKGVQLFN